MSGYLHTYADPGFPLQRQADVSVVMPTILRPSIADAVRSVFAQTLAGRIQLLIGVDAPLGDRTVLDDACRDRPPNVAVQLFYPGYSTSVRHGGLSAAQDGGVLRTVLTYLANSRHVAYLDDDNWWAPNHLRQLRSVCIGADWGYALRWFVHPATRRAVCIDEWESVGPGQGIYATSFGGFVDPSCLMIDKLRCAAAIPLWRQPLNADPVGQSSDRTVFAHLSRHLRGRATGAATVFYTLKPDDPAHPRRMDWCGPRYQAAGG